jgi:Kinase associated domain 1
VATAAQEAMAEGICLSRSIGRSLPRADNSSGSKHVQCRLIRFEIQIYHARSQQYIVDVQRLQGPLYLYLDLCSELLRFLAARSSPALPANLGGVHALGNAL